MSLTRDDPQDWEVWAGTVRTGTITMATAGSISGLAGQLRIGGAVNGASDVAVSLTISDAGSATSAGVWAFSLSTTNTSAIKDGANPWHACITTSGSEDVIAFGTVTKYSRQTS